MLVIIKNKFFQYRKIYFHQSNIIHTVYFFKIALISQTAWTAVVPYRLLVTSRWLSNPLLTSDSKFNHSYPKSSGDIESHACWGIFYKIKLFAYKNNNLLWNLHLTFSIRRGSLNTNRCHLPETIERKKLMKNVTIIKFIVV